ncbi:MAG: hypothetical protein JF605_21080 [Burkholderia sp.]|nr:hypothetical protein [Burkholderia sp.]
MIPGHNQRRDGDRRRGVKRIAGYTLAGLSACALMITTADANGRTASAGVKPRTSAQKHSNPGAGRAESARWRTGRRPCGRRCR